MRYPSHASRLSSCASRLDANILVLATRDLNAQPSSVAQARDQRPSPFTDGIGNPIATPLSVALRSS
jgi:hypothetical protein